MDMDGMLLIKELKQQSRFVKSILLKSHGMNVNNLAKVVSQQSVACSRRALHFVALHLEMA